ncbi:GNAT family N-acetyltransferase [Aquipuribacter sp. MA13-6]|uniref:GNAT family N-acetyltransferase n=1 Tax=unclassified Aquipuribacter TaxID=2635084 RepID=UPI003EF02D17
MAHVSAPVAGLRFRPPTAADAGGLHALMLACYEADDAQERETLEDVQELFATPWWDPATDGLVALDDEDRVRGYAQTVHRPGQLRTRQVLLLGGVHPDVRRRGVGRSLLAWQVLRGRQVLADVDAGLDVPRLLRTYVEDHVEDRPRLLRSAGFEPRRFSATMDRPVAPPLPDGPLPDDVRLVGLGTAGDELHERTRRAHNDAFAGHWGSEPIEPDDWRRAAVEGPGARPDLSFAVLDGEDRVVGYLISGTYPQDWGPQGFSEGWTNLLGVTPARRGQGLARALLVRAMGAYAAAGLQRAGLSVDVDNPRALELYTGLGYAERGRETSWVLDVPAHP